MTKHRKRRVGHASGLCTRSTRDICFWWLERARPVGPGAGGMCSQTPSNPATDSIPEPPGVQRQAVQEHRPDLPRPPQPPPPAPSWSTHHRRPAGRRGKSWGQGSDTQQPRALYTPHPHPGERKREQLRDWEQEKLGKGAVSDRTTWGKFFFFFF